MKKIWMLALWLLMGSANAYDGLTSELSHAAGGAVLASAVTRLYSESENRAWIGFAVSTSVIVLESAYQISRGAKRSSQFSILGRMRQVRPWGRGSQINMSSCL